MIHPLIRLSKLFAKLDNLGLHQPVSRREEVPLSIEITARQGSH